MLVSSLALLQRGSVKNLHHFTPSQKTWRQLHLSRCAEKLHMQVHFLGIYVLFPSTNDLQKFHRLLKNYIYSYIFLRFMLLPDFLKDLRIFYKVHPKEK